MIFGGFGEIITPDEVYVASLKPTSTPAASLVLKVTESATKAEPFWLVSHWWWIIIVAAALGILWLVLRNRGR